MLRRVDLLQAQTLRGEDSFAAYACLDTTGTREIFDTLYPRLNDEQRRIYEWSLRQQSPAVAMTLRGIRVDQAALVKAKTRLRAEIAAAQKALQQDPLIARFWDVKELETGDCGAGGRTKSGRPQKHKWPRKPKDGDAPDPAAMTCERCGAPRLRPKPFEATSPQQCVTLFYSKLLCPTVQDREGRVTCDDDALEKIGRDGVAYVSRAASEDIDLPGDGRVRKRQLAGLAQLVATVRSIRDLTKQLGFLDMKLSPAGRFHASFNVAAAWTGRWSSSKDPFGVGSNAQNITERHRHIFIPDAGRKFFYADLKTAESLKVAYMAGCEAYIEAHKGDVHTYVCRLCWPELPWTGDIKADKKIAQAHRPPWDDVEGHDYRFQSKRVQHGSNYGLTPHGMALIAHIPVSAARDAQDRYFDAFPEIRDLQRYIAERVFAGLPLYNALRRMVRLFGRPWDKRTVKQGLAFGPQGGVGDLLNLGLWRLWRDCDPDLIELLAQVHDAVAGQYRDELEEPALAAIRDLMPVRCPVVDFRGGRRVMTIPVEVAVGRNWGKFNDNPAKGHVNLSGLQEVA